MAQYLAVDLGADSGRVMLATLEGGKLRFEELHRFANTPEPVGDSLRWRIGVLFEEILTGMAKAKAAGARPTSVSCDSWGVDYGLLGKDGKLLEAPYIYRDKRTDGVPERVYAGVPRAEIFGATGIQFMQLNTLYQLVAANAQEGAPLQSADRFVMIGDLMNHLLCGTGVAERSLASTSQLFCPRKMDWAWELVDRLGLPRHVFPKVVDSGTRLGPLLPEVAKRTGLDGVGVVASCSHDTGAAVAAIPAARGDDWAYLSCGTWSLMGVELPEPCINAEVLEANFTNEVGYGGTIRFLKNITGLWLVQESRRAWEAEGKKFDFKTLETMAAAATPFQGFVRTDDRRFGSPGGMPGKIRDYLRETGQPAPGDEGSIIRVALESLALTYREVLDRIEALTGRKIARLHMVGGGTRDRLLCQLTADAIGRPVFAGPVEATAAGNALVQAIADGDLKDLPALRAVVRASFEITEYRPSGGEAWDEARARFAKLEAR